MQSASNERGRSLLSGWADHARGVDRSSAGWRNSARHPGRQHVGQAPDEVPRRGSTHVEDDNHFFEVVGFHFESARIRDNEFTAGGFSTLDFEFVALIPGVSVNLVILIAGDVQDDGLTTLDVDLLSVRVDLAVADRDVDGHGVGRLRWTRALRCRTAGAR